MTQLTVETLLLLDSFGTLPDHIRTGDQVLVTEGQLTELVWVLERNQILYELVPYRGLNMTMLILTRKN